MDLRYFFKARTDEPVEQQLQAYFLDEHENDIVVFDKITTEIMSEVDVIVGTQTTLLFDLLPYNKPIWILDTPFRLLFDMVEDGFARLICWDDMENIDDIFAEEISREINIDGEYFNGNVPVVDAIETYLQDGSDNRDENPYFWLYWPWKFYS